MSVNVCTRLCTYIYSYTYKKEKGEHVGKKKGNTYFNKFLLWAIVMGEHATAEL